MELLYKVKQYYGAGKQLFSAFYVSATNYMISEITVDMECADVHLLAVSGTVIFLTS